MSACRANFRRLGAYHQVTAVAAFPDLYFALFEDCGGFHVLQQSAVAFFVVLFDGSNHAELGGQFREAFLFGSFGEAFIHVGPFVVFAGSSSGQVGSGVTDAVQFLEPHFRMFFFVICGLQEECRNLLIAFLLGYGCEIGVFVSGTGFAFKCGVEVFLRLGACVFVCRSFFDQFQLVAGGFAKRANRGFAVLHFEYFSAYLAFVLFHCLRLG